MARVRTVVRAMARVRTRARVLLRVPVHVFFGGNRERWGRERVEREESGERRVGREWRESGE